MAFNRGKRISLVGLGRMGEFHARVLARLGSLSCVVDARKDRAAAKGEEYGVPYYDNIVTMLDKEEPDGVVIAVPTRSHEQAVLEIMKARKLPAVVLLEKPVADTLEAALRIKKAIDGQITIIVGHSEVYNPVVSRMISLVNSETLGVPRTIIFQRRSPVSESRLESIGDIFEDLGVHDFNILTKLVTGEVRVYCTAIRRNNYYNTANILITREKNGRTDLNCSLLLSREYAGKTRTIEIEGSKATMQVDLLAQIIDIRSLEEAVGERGSIKIPFSGSNLKVYGEPLQEELLNVIDCIDGKAVPLVTLDDGIDALRIAKACRESLNRKAPVELVLK